MRALEAGIPLERIGKTTLREIELRSMAREYEEYRRAQTLLELKLMDMSAEALGEAEDRSGKTDEELARMDERAKKQPSWIEVGSRIKAKARADMHYGIMPDFMKAAYHELYGEPDADPVNTALPLQGVSQSVARDVVALLETRELSRGAWGRSALHRQLGAGDARNRLQATAEFGPALSNEELLAGLLGGSLDDVLD